MRCRHRRNRAWSLVGVLAALVVFSTVLMGLFRLNHQAEQAFYRTSPPHNTARFHAWCLLKGLPQVPPEELSVTPQNKDSVHYYQIHQDEVSFYVIPQKK